MPYIIIPKEGEKAWVTYIKKEIASNRNFMMIFTGPPGSGKSYGSLKIAEDVCEGFTIDNVFFNAIELLKFIESGKATAGVAMVFEETGVAVGHRQWQSLTNRAILQLFQTYRHRNLILIMNSPSFTFVDKSIRQLFHANFMTQAIDKKNKQAIVRPYFIQYNPHKDKVYTRFLTKIGPNYDEAVEQMRIDLPSKSLLEAYEEKKSEYTHNLNVSLIEQLQAYMETTKKKWKCWDCKHVWVNRNAKQPTYCPKCRNKHNIKRHKAP